MSNTRKPYPSDQLVYEAAARWRDRCLLDDRSLFADGPGWSLDAIEALRRDFVEQPEVGTGDFVSKLRAQIGQSGAEAVQVAAEMVYVYLLIAVSRTISPGKKRELVMAVLAIDAATSPMPEDLSRVLDAGLVKPGQAFNNYRWKMLAFLVEFTRALKSQSVAQRQRILSDPAELARFCDAIDVSGAETQSFAIQHLLLPDHLPAIVSKTHRQQIIDTVVPDLVGQEPPGPIIAAMAGMEPNVVWDG